MVHLRSDDPEYVRFLASVEEAGGVIAGMNPVGTKLTEDESECLLIAADLVTRARTGVEFDRQGKVAESHALEMKL